MDEITPNSDTVEFKDWMDAKIVDLDGSVFYQDFKNGYMEIIMQGPLALAVRNRFVLVEDQGILEAAGLTDQANASSVSNGMAVVKYDRMYQLQRTYFFFSSRNQVFEANRLSLFKLLPVDRDEIIDFLKKNSISFQNKEDLMILLTFFNHLIVN